jgi:hypothetical protein
VKPLLITAGIVLSLIAAVGCNSGGGGTTAEQPAVIDPTEEPVVEEPAEEPVGEAPATVKPKPASAYKKLSDRAWAKVVKSPDKYKGKTFILYACITQFDGATGDEMFRADASNKKEDYWFNCENAVFAGPVGRLDDYVVDDLVLMRVTALGEYSYDTQIGGNTTVPMFQVDKISPKGSCAL